MNPRSLAGRLKNYFQKLDSRVALLNVTATSAWCCRDVVSTSALGATAIPHHRPRKFRSLAPFHSLSRLVSGIFLPRRWSSAGRWGLTRKKRATTTSATTRTVVRQDLRMPMDANPADGTYSTLERDRLPRLHGVNKVYKEDAGDGAATGNIFCSGEQITRRMTPRHDTANVKRVESFSRSCRVARNPTRTYDHYDRRWRSRIVRFRGSRFNHF